MKVSKKLKGLVIALPLVALAACSSTEVEQAPAPAPEPQVDYRAEALAQLRQASTFFFKYDNAQIDPQYEILLSSHADFLKKYSNESITIEGHADERGTPEYNIALGQRRAEAVADYLQALGVSSSQISIVSYGEERPLEMDSSEAAYSRNRRAVILY